MLKGEIKDMWVEMTVTALAFQGGSLRTVVVGMEL